MKGGKPWLLAVAGAWGMTWVQQSNTWRANVDYRYGFIVPILAIFLFVERWLDRPAVVPRPPGLSLPDTIWAGIILAATLIELPSRLLLEGFPGWPAPLWVQASATSALTLGLLGSIGGRPWLRHFARPVLFALTALPWPSFLHRILVQNLMTTVASLAAMVVDLLGRPAQALGNVVQVGNGMVGVDEACSGIRSLQATVMAALFIGEYLRWSIRRQATFLLSAVGIAFVANLVRTTLLTWHAAKAGPDAVERWHDPAGVSIMAINLSALAFLAWWFHRSPRPQNVGGILKTQRPHPGWSRLSTQCAWATLAIVAAGEIGPRLWFAHRSSHLATNSWRVRWPETASGFATIPVNETVLQQLGCDRIESRRWHAPDGSLRQANLIRWNSSSAGRNSTALHSPTVCLPLSGFTLLHRESPVVVSVNGLTLTFDVMAFRHADDTFYVYHCVYDEQGAGPANRPTGVVAWWSERLHEIQEASHGRGLQVLTFARWDDNDPVQAEAELRSMITQPSGRL
jgi:exosortase